MNRKERLLQLLEEAKGPIKGVDLSMQLGVSRQAVVQYIAVLRASGHTIISTPQGYMLPPKGGHKDVIAVKHGPERTAEELYLLVDMGVKVRDVIVEHPIYGELQGFLMLESREDVARFLNDLQGKKASLLSALTDGFHLHTVEARTPALIEEARARLKERGFLAEEGL